MLGTSHLLTVPHGTPAMLEAWSDAVWLRAALDFEAALAAAQSETGMIDSGYAAVIAEVAAGFTLDPAELAAGAAHAGTLAIPFLAALRAAVAAREPTGAALLHHGATSQDIADTAMVVQARAGVALILADMTRLVAALAAVARAHAQTRLTGRTLLQPALPVTLGLKCAQWMLAAHDAATRLRREADTALVLQLGGGAGTLDGMGGQGAKITLLVAAKLGLPAPPLPWHARRGNLAGLAAACAICAGEAAKMARDIALLAQAEIGEAREPEIAGRGASSTMAHKRNQTLCQRALTAAARAPGLAATLLAGLPQEHERGLGGWQAEAPTLAALFCATHSGIAAMAEAAEGLHLDPEAMARNLAAAGIGQDAGESARMTHTALALLEPPPCPS